MPPPRTTVDALVDRYDAFIFDAFGVLLTSAGALPGAVELLSRLDAEGRPFVIVTNDASRHPDTASRWYRSLGIDVSADRILTSGALLTSTLRRDFPDGCRALILGTDDSRRMAREGGAEVVTEGPVDVIAVCDESGYPLLETAEEALNLAIAGIERGAPLALYLANPDPLYPQGGGRLGLAAGSIALLIENAMKARLPDVPSPLFRPLGKPHRPIFDEARRRLGEGPRILMLGDQLATDVKGALGAGIDAALVGTGISRAPAGSAEVVPTWLVDDLT